VIVSLDTLRADRLGRMRDGKSLTPRLDALAAESVRFTHALANASYTLPSHVSLFTSQRPGDHGVLFVFDAFDAGRSPNVARLLAARGFATAAFTSGGMLNAGFCGIDVGFDRYGEVDALLTADDRLRDSAPLQQRAAWNRELARRRRLDADVLPWLRSHRGAPFLLFLHSYLTHNYQPEPELRAEFTRGLPATPLELHGAAPYRAQLCTDYLASGIGKGDRRFGFRGDGQQQFVAERDLPWFEALYDATVAQADRDVGRLLDALEQDGLAQRTLVVVTSDHGEEFLEHGDLSHARTLFDEILRVPLLIRVPGMAPRVVDEPVELIDVAPTLLARLGIAPDPRMRGSDLLAPGFEARRITIHEGAGVGDPSRTRRAARMRDGKLIVVAPLAARGDARLSAAAHDQLEALGYLLGHDGRELPPELVPEYYDLALDPREQRDLAHDEAREKKQSLRMAELAQELGAAPFGRTEGG
jgi:arylsulfatase A-like enzyme